MRQLATLTAIVSLAFVGCAEESREQTTPPAAPRSVPDPGFTRAPSAEEPVVVAGPPQAGAADVTGSACPLRSKSAQVATSDIEGGIAIELSSDQVPPVELETFARHLAAIEEGQMGPRSGPGTVRTPQRPGPRSGMGPGPGRAAGPGPGKYMRELPPSTIKVERTGQRVWMTIVAENRDQVDSVRELGRAAAEAMRTGECPLARE